MEKKNNLEYNFIFVGLGSNANSSDPLKPETNKFILDTGNSLQKGVIDHHHFKNGYKNRGQVFKSTAGVLSVNKHLILDNYDKSNNKITIVVHENPDFDCFITTYMVMKILETGELPQRHELLVQYAERFDRGLMRIDYNNLEAPHLICHFFSETCKKKNDDRDVVDSNLVMKKGLRLVEFIVNYMNRLNRSITEIDESFIIPVSHQFDEELKLIKKDYSKYVNDKSNICEVVKIKLPSKSNPYDQLIEVDGIFWNDVPTCMLHKFWARAEGLIFTFIPQETKDMEFEKSNYKTNRVIISVDPSSEVCLKDLGRFLELEEQKKENIFFKGDLKNKWRSRELKRFDEEWCDNENPWYDGRGQDYTIVDSPRDRLSLLTIGEIKEITKEYSKFNTKDSFNRYIFKFHFPRKLFDDFKFNNMKPKQELTEESIRYFLPYIRDYLFKVDEDDIRNMHVLNLKKDCKINLPIDDENMGYINEIAMSIFKEGIGFLIVDVEACENDKTIQGILKLNKMMIKNSDKVFSCLIKSFLKNSYLEEKLTFKPGDVFTYTLVELDKAEYYGSEKKELIYRLCNSLSIDEKYKPNSLMDKLMEKFFLEVEEYAIYGFRKTGGALLIINDSNNDTITNEKIKKLKNMFKTVDYHILILGLLQREVLLKFSHELSIYNGKDKKTKVNRLRKNILDFTTQSWFSQITNDEIGMIKYKKWQEVLDNKTIYDEVENQITLVDEYNKSATTSKVELASIFLLPLVILGALYDIEIFKTTTPGFELLSKDKFLLLIALYVISIIAIKYKEVIRLFKNKF